MKKFFKEVKESLNLLDTYTICMLLIYIILDLIFWKSLNNPIRNLLTYIGFGILVGGFAYYTRDYEGGKFFRLIRKIYIIPVVYFVYSQIHTFIPVVNPHDYDNILIAWDRAIFGVNPTEWLEVIHHPILTEYLQFTYMTFFFIPIVIGVEFTRNGKDEEFYSYARYIIFGFYLSYLLYFFMPAIGPRFTIHNFSTLNYEMPGILLTEFFREYVNYGGGIAPDTINPAETINRDCMPSGHTMMTLMNIILAFMFRSKLKWIILIIGGSLIFSTIYLRYHYVVDVIAGIIFAFIALWLEPKIEQFLRNKGFHPSE